MASRVKHIVLKFAGVIDVASVSATNFIVSLFILRELSDSQYAIYVNLFSVLMLLSTIQNAFINTALSVHCSKISDKFEKENHAFHLCVLSNLAQVLCFLPVMLFGLSYPIWLVVFVYFAHAMYLNRELYRTYNFVFGNKSRVILSSIVLVVSLSTALLIGVTFDIQSLEFIYAVLAMSGLLSTTMLVLGVSRKQLSVRSLTSARKTVASFAKWTSLGSFATWAQNNSYTYLATIIIGLEATAALAAARLITMPINVVASGIYMAEKPKWASLYATDKKRLKTVSKRVTEFMFAFVAIFSMVSFFMMDSLSNLLATDLDVVLLMLWFLSAAIQCFKFSNSNILNVSEDFKYLGLMGTKVAILGVAFSAFLGFLFGAKGILIGFCLGEFMHFINTRKRINTSGIFSGN